MIERPKQSVTRFFIPLIDVMILLFCIFLLMPYQKGNAESTDGKKVIDEKDRTPQEMNKEVASLREDIDLARREIDKLRNEKINPTERLSVCVLEIEPKNGHLFYYRDGVRKPLPDRRAAQDAIDDHKRRSGIDKEPFFIVLMPRDVSGHPDNRQMEEYASWFKDVPHRFDSPLGAVVP